MWRGTADLLPRFARAYGIAPFWDYGRPGGGLLLANGTGTMLAAMDEIPSLSFCADLTGVRAGDVPRWSRFLLCAERCIPQLAASLICFIDDPAPLCALIEQWPSSRLSVYSNRVLHPCGTPGDWAGFVARGRSQGQSMASCASTAAVV